MDFLLLVYKSGNIAWVTYIQEAKCIHVFLDGKLSLLRGTFTQNWDETITLLAIKRKMWAHIYIWRNSTFRVPINTPSVKQRIKWQWQWHWNTLWRSKISPRPIPKRQPKHQNFKVAAQPVHSFRFQHFLVDFCAQWQYEKSNSLLTTQT